MAVDTSSHMHNSNMVDEGGGTAYAFDKIKVGNKEYYTNIINIWERPISLENPMRINLSNNPKQYVIFGEQATSKRYMFRNGRLIWIPN